MIKYEAGIINYNSGKILSECISSLLAQEFPPVNIHIWDNASSDDSLIIAQKKFPSILIHRHNENLGYGPAINRLQELMNSSWMLFCNMDLKFDPHWSSEISKGINDFPKHKSFASLIVEENSPPTINAARILFHSDMSPYCPEDGLSFQDTPIKNQEVFGPYGAVIFIHQDLFSRVGTFYEPFFLFYEETDYFIRANKKGFKTQLLSKAMVWHHRSLATVRFSPMKIFYPERNRILSLRMNYGMLKTLICILKSPPRYLNQNKLNKNKTDSFQTSISKFKIISILIKAHIQGLTMKVPKNT